MLSLKHISKSYGDHLVFEIPELRLLPGIYWLKGGNGAGKSTLLKTIAGLIPFKGDITLNDNFSLKNNPVAYREKINHAEAEPQFPSFLSGNDLCQFVYPIKKGTTQQLSALKEILKIDNYLGNPVGSYSSGMLKKLSLLLAFAGEPEWILLDEPLTTLDLAAQEAVCRLVAAKRKEGISFLLTSHHEPDQSLLPFDGAFGVQDQQLIPYSFV